MYSSKDNTANKSKVNACAVCPCDYDPRSFHFPGIRGNNFLQSAFKVQMTQKSHACVTDLCCQFTR